MSEQPSQTPQPPNGSQEHPVAPSDTPVEPATDSVVKPEPDLDASIEQDIDMNAEKTQPTGDDNAPNPTDVDPMAAAPTPSKKETSLREFLGKMDDYAPIVGRLLSSFPPISSFGLDYATLRPPAKLLRTPRVISPYLTSLSRQLACRETSAKPVHGKLV